MYKNPITVTWNELGDTIEKVVDDMANEMEENIYQAVIKLNIKIDREELEMALRYDRQQYDKGYADGLLDGKRIWHRLPETIDQLKDHYYYLVKYKDYGTPMKAKYHLGERFDVYGCGCGDKIETVYEHELGKELTHWAELPELPEGDCDD